MLRFCEPGTLEISLLTITFCNSRILEHLSALPISDEGEAKHFVHLTQVLEKIYELAKLDDPEVDKKVLEVIKRVKSLPIMKTSLNKLGDVTVIFSHYMYF